MRKAFETRLSLSNLALAHYQIKSILDVLSLGGKILERNNAREERLVSFLVTEILVHLAGRVGQRSTYHGGQEVERGGPCLQGSALCALFLQPDLPAAISPPPKSVFKPRIYQWATPTVRS